MPRDGSGVYAQPFPVVVTGTTIESAVFNGNTTDVAQDLNTPRPIVAGGTGANNAHDAMIALGGEIAKQGDVRNFDTFAWASGSFYATAGATAGPPSGGTTVNRFAGIYYANADDSYAFVEARDQTTGNLYMRAKTAGLWGAWTKDTVANPVAPTDPANKTYVDAGDVAATNVANTAQAAANAAQSTANTANSAAATAQSTANAANSAASAAQTAANNANANANNRVLRSGDTMSGGLTVNAAFNANTVNSTGNIGTAASLFASGNLYIGSGLVSLNYSTGSRGIRLNGDDSLEMFGPANVKIRADGRVEVGRGVLSKNGYSGAFGTVSYTLDWGSGAFYLKGDDTGLGFISVTSDYRVKKDVADLSGTWNTVKALRPITYTQAAYGDLFIADDIVRWGFLAHELQGTLTQSAATGVKDDPDHIQSPNPWTVIAALTKALQEAMARIEALEAA